MEPQRLLRNLDTDSDATPYDNESTRLKEYQGKSIHCHVGLTAIVFVLIYIAKIYNVGAIDTQDLQHFLNRIHFTFIEIKKVWKYILTLD